MALILPILLLFMFQLVAAGDDDCPRLRYVENGKFDQCGDKKGCPVGSKAKILCNPGYRPRPFHTLTCSRWNKTTTERVTQEQRHTGKSATATTVAKVDWTPVMNYGCVPDPTTYSGGKNKGCSSGVCSVGTEATFSCSSNILCGSPVSICQKQSEFESDWSESTPSCTDKNDWLDCERAQRNGDFTE